MSRYTTPRRVLARPRPSLLNQSLGTSSTPDLGASYAAGLAPPPSHSSSTNPTTSAGLSAREALARKASLNQLTSNSLATIPDGSVGYGLSTVEDEEGIASSSPITTGTMPPTTPASTRRATGEDGGGGGEIEVGDLVDVPGGMHGTIKFLGTVKGKKGVFAGVELSREFAPRGKNDGDVEG